MIQYLIIILLVFSPTVIIQNKVNSNKIKSNKMKTNIPTISDFPTGEENIAFAQYFIGKSYLAPLTSNKDLNVPISNVTFEPGCRNNWHSHTGGQLLIVVGGEGLYQERGKPARRLKSGDIVEIAPNVEHWHGATAESWFSHLATNGNPKTNQNTWLKAVSDEEYAEANKNTFL
jgi:quercetin dioxygenase-like cupin family protein